jgi:predicted dehydrogenase
MAGNQVIAWMAVVLFAFFCSCTGPKQEGKRFMGTPEEVKLLTLDPGHFHAALVQKTMYPQVSPRVSVYAPEGPDVEDHLRRIQDFNQREKNPTRWEEKVYRGKDYLERMLEESQGNVVVISGNNRKKAEYIKACMKAGLNVLSDKPMCIDGKGFGLLKEAFDLAEEKGLLLYDIMTERSEITTILQKELVHNEAVFGVLLKGTTEDPAVVKESVHHFFKYVAGNPIKRPAWFCDTTQQGEGIVDVTTHLVDLVMWGCFPNQILDFDRDVKMKKGRRWPTLITREQYSKVTRLDDFPSFLKGDLNEEGVYPCFANGEMVFALKGVHARVTVMWNFQAPEGTGDTHYSLIRGSKALLIIRQGEAEAYRPELYVEAAKDADRGDLSRALKKAVLGLQQKYPGVALDEQGDRWHVKIPDEYRIGHEAHFRQVTERYLEYLVEGSLPSWEVPNMITKYRITTQALERALR